MDDLSRTLGAIEAKLDMVAKTQAEDRVASAQYRTDMRRDLTEVRDSVGDLKNRVNNTTDEVADVRDIVDKRISDVDKRIDGIAADTNDYRSWKLRAEGAGKVTKILWAIFSAIGLGGLITFLQSLRSGH
jgi:hypothetical protein